MTSLSDAERDAVDLMQALAGMATLLHWPADDLPSSGGGVEAADDARQLLLRIAEEGGQAAARIVAYLREQRGAGDGELIAVPRRLGQWRDWVPGRGHVFGISPGGRRPDGVPQPRRRDPGE